MSLRDFISKQYIDVIQWTEEESGTLATRYPMQDLEIQNGARLTVRESQMAAFINEGRLADVFGPGLYTLTTQNLPILTDLLNWDKKFRRASRPPRNGTRRRPSLSATRNTAVDERDAPRSGSHHGCSRNQRRGTSHQILHRLWQIDHQGREILSGMRR